MLAFELFSAAEVGQTLAERAKAGRLALNLTQEMLASRSGVTLASLRRFERTGLMSLEGFIRLMMALGRVAELDQLLRPRQFTRIEDVVAKVPIRKRARRTAP